MLTVVRESNVTLRWLLLHTTQPKYYIVITCIPNLLTDPDLSASVSQHKRTRQLVELVRQEARVTHEDMMELLVLVSRLEQLTRSLYTR